MKLKFWQFEYDFDKEDAKIVVPLILLLIAISTINRISPMLLIGITSVYYLLYFFSASIVKYTVRKILKCPSCKNKKIILNGYQEFAPDRVYQRYYCGNCNVNLLLIDGVLVSHIG